jgi:hypothetical protein
MIQVVLLSIGHKTKCKRVGFIRFSIAISHADRIEVVYANVNRQVQLLV